MFTQLRNYTVVAISLCLTACSSITVTTDYDHTASFSQYRSYTLAPSTEKIPLSPSSDTALRQTLSATLFKRGIIEKAENADLHVIQHVSTQEKLAVFQSNDWGYAGMRYGYGRYGMWAGAPYNYTDVSQYTEGTLILDFVDTKTQKLVFRGVATGTVSDPETNAKRIREAVEEIVQEFPVDGAH